MYLELLLSRVIYVLKVRYGCDVDLWSAGPGRSLQTLLHRAIDENQDDIACFLIRQ